MEIITPFQLYWILRLDAIWSVFLIGSMVTGIVTGVMSIMYFPFLEDYSKEQIKKYEKIWKRFSLAFGIFLLLAVLIPDTREACAIYAVPKVVNNPKIQELCGNSLDVFGMGVKRIKDRMLNAKTDK